MNLNRKIITQVFTVVLFGMVLFSGNAYAVDEVFLDFFAPANYQSELPMQGGPGTTCGYSWVFDNTWYGADIEFTMKPTANVSVCQLQFAQEWVGTGASFSDQGWYVSVTASPSSSDYYGFESDQSSTLAVADGWSDQVITFYNGELYPDNPFALGLCPVMYGGHEYVWRISRTNKSSGYDHSPSTDCHYDEYPKVRMLGTNISSSVYDVRYQSNRRYSESYPYTQSTWTELGDDWELDMRMTGYPTWGTGLIGGVEYESLNPASWSEQYDQGGNWFTQTVDDWTVEGIMDGFSHLINYYFNPSNAGETISNEIDYWLTKAPFSYVSEINDLWESSSFAANSSASGELSITVPYAYGTATTSLELFSEDTVMIYLGDTWDIFYDIMVAAVWLGAIYYIYKRVLSAI